MPYRIKRVGKIDGVIQELKTSYNHLCDVPADFIPKAHTHIELGSNTDNRTVATIPDAYNAKFKIVGLKTNTVIGIPTSEGTYSGVLGIRGWSDKSGGNSHELAFTGNGNIYQRHGADIKWDTAWRKIVLSDDLKTINGNSILGTGNITISGGTGSSDILGVNPLSLIFNNAFISINGPDGSGYINLNYDGQYWGQNNNTVTLTLKGDFSDFGIKNGADSRRYANINEFGFYGTIPLTNNFIYNTSTNQTTVIFPARSIYNYYTNTNHNIFYKLYLPIVKKTDVGGSTSPLLIPIRIKAYLTATPGGD